MSSADIGTNCPIPFELNVHSGVEKYLRRNAMGWENEVAEIARRKEMAKQLGER